jgi:hypothetical protein
MAFHKPEAYIVATNRPPSRGLAMMAPMGDDILLDEREAGRYLGGTDRPISPRTLQRWRQRGTGPTFVRVGNLIRYRRRADLDRYLGTRIARSTADRVEEPS